MNLKINNYSSKGFTLIELLVVIGVLGVLAAAVLTAVNPVEQLARGRDSSKKSTVNQLGRAVLAYYTSQGVLPPEGAAVDTWILPLQTSGEIKSIPGVATPTCANAAALHHNGYCYDVVGSEAAIYILAESASERNRVPVCTARTWIVWTSLSGKTGKVCTTAAAYPTTTSVVE